MKVITTASFTASNMPVVTIPAGLIPVPQAPSATFGSNLVGWWKTDAGLTVSGSNVSSWVDQSATPLTVSTANQAQTTNTVAPTVVLNAVGTGGLNGVVFQGNTSGETLLSTAADPAKLQFTGSSAFSVAFAFTLNNTSQFGALASYGVKSANVSTGWYIGEFSGKIGLAWVPPSGGANGTILYTNTALATGKSYIIVLNYDGAGNITVYVNGTAVPASGTASTIITTNITSQQYFVIGGGSGQTNTGLSAFGYATSDALGELVIVNRLMTTAEVTNVCSYLDSRFSIY